MYTMYIDIVELKSVTYPENSYTSIVIWYGFIITIKIPRIDIISCSILKQKSLATHYRHAYLLQKSTLKEHKLNKVFFALNAITILSITKYWKNSFVWSALPVIKCF